MRRQKRPNVSPGEVVREELAARGWTQQQFAEVIGRSRQFVSSLLAGRASLTFDVAFRLEAAFDVSAQTWLRMESLYREELERDKIDAIRRSVASRARKLDSVAETRARYGS
jgi:HTH-type transcriptional regulator/antitoxin HigA